MLLRALKHNQADDDERGRPKAQQMMGLEEAELFERQHHPHQDKTSADDEFRREAAIIGWHGDPRLSVRCNRVARE